MEATEDPFRSRRLLYRAVEPSEDEAFFLAIQTDPIAFRNSNNSVNHPQGKSSANKYMKWVADDTLLGVVICLPPAAAAAAAPNTPDAREEAAAAAAATTDPRPTPIGCIHLAGIQSNHLQHRCSEIGVDILKPYQGRGYGSEAIRWVLDWAFETAGLHRVAIGAFEYNHGAVRLYERLGFVREGVSREEIWHAGRWWDGVRFSILDREWKDVRERKAVEG